MYFRFVDSFMTNELSRELSAYTNRAKLHIRQVCYSEETGVLTLPITRYPITRDKRLTGLISYKRDLHAGVRSVVTIRDVASCLVEDRAEDSGRSEVELMFGLTVRGLDILVCSSDEVEEKREVPVYSMTVEVRGYDIEIADTQSPGTV